jgi:hypothetical protein
MLPLWAKLCLFTVFILILVQAIAGLIMRGFPWNIP